MPGKVLGFNLLNEQLDNEIKLQTIRSPRLNPDYELRVGDTVTMLWRPRTKFCLNMGKARITKVVPKAFKIITEEDALRDGFLEDDLVSARERLENAFKKLHKKGTPDTVYNIITFEWIEHRKIADMLLAAANKTHKVYTSLKEAF